MADVKGNNSRQLPDSPFGQPFPGDGAPMGGQNPSGLFEPVNLDANGYLLVTAAAAGTASMLRGATSSISTTAIQIIASPGTTTAIYLTGLQFGNTSTVTVVATLNDSVSSNFILPAGGGSNVPGLAAAPLRVSAASALTMTLSAAVTTVYVNAQGYGAA